MNIMTIQGIRRVESNRLEYSYTVEGEWSRFFETSNPMWVEYSRPVDQVPDSIAVLPLIGNVIVLAALMDADIYVEEIDRDFYQCIEEFIQGYDDIMPDHVHFKHRDIVHAKKILENPLADNGLEENLLFFSGGVDATFSLVQHLEEKPALLTIWGADIPWNNEDGWQKAIGFNQAVADRYDLPLLTIRSNFRKSLYNDGLEDYSMALVDDWWWSAFHHSVAMMCLAAPMAGGKRTNLYFGSTYSSKDHADWGSYVTASDPKIDNHVRFCGCQVVHDGYEFSRYDKIHRICDFYANQKEKPYLRVCYLSNTGKNCGTCEKCASSIMSILLAGGDPTDYGFQYNAEEHPRYFAAGLQEMGRAEKYACLSFYYDVQAAYRQQHTPDQVPPVLRAFYEVELDVLADFLFAPNNECIEAVKAAHKFQDQLYMEIGQLKYQKQCLQTEADRAALLSADLDSLTQEKAALSEECRGLQERNQTLQEHNHALQEHNRALQEQLDKMYRSTSWKLTKPLRFLMERIRRIIAG